MSRCLLVLEESRDETNSAARSEGAGRTRIAQLNAYPVEILTALLLEPKFTAGRLSPIPANKPWVHEHAVRAPIAGHFAFSLGLEIAHGTPAIRINHSLARAVARDDAGAVAVTWKCEIAAGGVIAEPELAHQVDAPAPDRASSLQRNWEQSQDGRIGSRKVRSFPEDALQGESPTGPAPHLHDAIVVLSSLEVNDVWRTVVRGRTCPHQRREESAEFEDEGNNKASF